MSSHTVLGSVRHGMLQCQRSGARSQRAFQIIRVAVILGLFLFAQNATAIVVSIDNLAVHLVGEIGSKDVAELKKHIGRSPVGYVMLYVNSRGGNWEAAMALGRLLRASRSAVTVGEGSVCLSSCVILLAGATTRIVDERARVGIHRPFSSSTKPVSFEQAQAQYRRLETQTREYLREMNMPESLWDAVVATPPEQMKILSYKELETFRLAGKDPALQEVEDSDAARKYGITKEVYFVRKNQVWPKCGSLFPTRAEIDGNQEIAVSKLTAYNKCEHAVLHGEK